MNGNDVATFLGVSIGNWFQWGAGIAFTIINFWILESRYKREHTERIIYRVSNLVERKNNLGKAIGIYGLELAVLNVGIPTKVRFAGLTKHHFHGRWLIIQTLKKLPVIWRFKWLNEMPPTPSGVDEREFDLKTMDPDSLFHKATFNSMQNINDEFVVSFDEQELFETLLMLVKRDKSLIKRIKDNNNLLFDANFVTFDGHVKSIKLRIHSDEPMYQKVREAIVKE